ncbi:hypothetical protein L2E82_01888 [Cichorium intybus]|uniref:Uncharacterized protein n=1 Tax=Cichorium intybus TaxID=13427 RepID=A0ACB9H1E7_CICIN|nr:hypothetical protein L2E82_01888 [Cichorium intybus]
MTWAFQKLPVVPSLAILEPTTAAQSISGLHRQIWERDGASVLQMDDPASQVSAESILGEVDGNGGCLDALQRPSIPSRM